MCSVVYRHRSDSSLLTGETCPYSLLIGELLVRLVSPWCTGVDIDGCIGVVVQLAAAYF